MLQKQTDSILIVFCQQNKLTILSKLRASVAILDSLSLPVSSASREKSDVTKTLGNAVLLYHHALRRVNLQINVINEFLPLFIQRGDSEVREGYSL